MATVKAAAWPAARKKLPRDPSLSEQMPMEGVSWTSMSRMHGKGIRLSPASVITIGFLRWLRQSRLSKYSTERPPANVVTVGCVVQKTEPRINNPRFLICLHRSPAPQNPSAIVAGLVQLCRRSGRFRGSGQHE